MTTDTTQAWTDLEAAQAELEAAQSAVHFVAGRGREVGLWRLAVAERRWDEADRRLSELAVA